MSLTNSKDKYLNANQHRLHYHRYRHIQNYYGHHDHRGLHFQNHYFRHYEEVDQNVEKELSGASPTEEAKKIEKENPVVATPRDETLEPVQNLSDPV